MKKVQWHLPKNPVGVRNPTSYERIAYIGCIHQITPDLLKNMEQLCADPPDFVFFGGDLTGSKEFDTLKYHFYEVTNPGRGKLKLHEAPATTAIQDVLTFPTKEGRTLADEYRDLAAYLTTLEGLENRALFVQDCFYGIMIICGFPDYGSFARTLSAPVREKLANSFAETSEILLPYIKRLQEFGVEVHMIAGNWDNVPNTAKNVGMDTVFDAAAFFNNNAVEFHETINTVETETTLHVLVPYWDFWSATPPVFPEMGRKRLNEVMPAVQSARKEGKTVIVLAHGQPLWEPHFPGQTCKGYNVDVMNNLSLIIDTVRPDEFIYPHQHDPLKSCDGATLPVNTHYFLCSLGEGKIEIVEDGEPIDTPNITIATYTPLRHVAHLSVPRAGNRRPRTLSGNRLPAMVQANN